MNTPPSQEISDPLSGSHLSGTRDLLEAQVAREANEPPLSGIAQRFHFSELIPLDRDQVIPKEFLLGDDLAVSMLPSRVEDQALRHHISLEQIPVLRSILHRWVQRRIHQEESAADEETREKENARLHDVMARKNGNIHITRHYLGDFLQEQRYEVRVNQRGFPVAIRMKERLPDGARSLTPSLLRVLPEESLVLLRDLVERLELMGSRGLLPPVDMLSAIKYHPEKQYFRITDVSCLLVDGKLSDTHPYYPCPVRRLSEERTTMDGRKVRTRFALAQGVLAYLRAELEERMDSM